MAEPVLSQKAGAPIHESQRLPVPRCHPRDLAYLAMTQHHLGHAQEAQEYFQQLRDGLKDSWPHDADAQGFFREAEALLGSAKTPAGR
jgi:hypothetical protein